MAHVLPTAWLSSKWASENKLLPLEFLRGLFLLWPTDCDRNDAMWLLWTQPLCDPLCCSVSVCLSSFSLLPFSPLLPLVSLCLSVSGILSSFVSLSLFFSHSLSPSLFLECLPSQTYCHNSEEFGTHGEVTCVRFSWVYQAPLDTWVSEPSADTECSRDKPCPLSLAQSEDSPAKQMLSLFEALEFWGRLIRPQELEHTWQVGVGRCRWAPVETALRQGSEGSLGVVKRLSVDTGHVAVGCPWEVGMRHANKMKKITLEDREKGILASHRKNNCPACVDVENGKCTQEAGQPS